MGSDIGWGVCLDCQKVERQGPLHIFEPGNHGHQVVPFRSQVPPRRLPGGHTRYWGVIAFHKTGRMSNEGLITVFGCVAIFIIAAMVLFATYELTKQYEVEHPAVFQQHQPSDLDQGGNPPSFERGAAGPQGPPGYPGRRIMGR